MIGAAEGTVPDTPTVLATGFNSPEGPAFDRHGNLLACADAVQDGLAGQVHELAAYDLLGGACRRRHPVEGVGFGISLEEPETVAGIAARLVRGDANKAIAIDLELSERTVELHRARILHKMEARGVAQLVQMILRGPQGFSDSPSGGGTRLTSSMFSTEMLRVLSDARDERS